MKYLRTCRRFLAACLAFLMLAVLPAGCGKASADLSGSAASQQDPSEKRLQVVATIFPQYDFARQIAGDSADVYMLLKPGEEVHSYEPTPQDIRMIQNCDLFIYVGGENDVWVDNILESLADDGPVPVRLLDLVDTYSEEHLEGMMPEKGEHDHDHGEDEEEADHDHDHEAGDEESAIHSHVHEEEPDEHVWTSPENCVTLIGKLTDMFCELDPARADTYRKNGDAYRAAFEELDAEYRRMAAGASRTTILFGDRFPFRYLAEELGLTCYAAFSGCSSESEPSAATIAFLIDKAAEEKLPVVFKIEFSNGNIAAAISEAAQVRLERQTRAETAKETLKETAKEATTETTNETAKDPVKGTATGSEKDTAMQPASQTGSQVRVLQLHSCHNLTRDEFSSGETCLSLMTRNLEALREALY